MMYVPMFLLNEELKNPQSPQNHRVILIFHGRVIVQDWTVAQTESR